MCRGASSSRCQQASRPRGLPPRTTHGTAASRPFFSMPLFAKEQTRKPGAATVLPAPLQTQTSREAPPCCFAPAAASAQGRPPAPSRTRPRRSRQGHRQVRCPDARPHGRRRAAHRGARTPRGSRARPATPHAMIPATATTSRSWSGSPLPRACLSAPRAQQSVELLAIGPGGA